MLPRIPVGHVCVSICLYLLLSSTAMAGVAEAVAALKRGDYEIAYREFDALAQQGDSKAMVTIGMFYYKGEGFPQDYAKAMEWFQKAMTLDNGDAYNNIGVMFRDGLGVPKNRAIAYDLFLIVHMRGLGGQSTQLRANRNLRREIDELSEDQVRYALCLSEEQVLTYVGNPGTQAAHTIRTPNKHIAIKDREWWLDGELPPFDCQ